MHRIFFKAASFCMLLAVVIGAFGAHWLKQIISSSELESIQTGVTYQVYHSFGLFITGIIFRIYRIERIKYAGYFFLTGIVLFSGSIYLRIMFQHLQLSKSNLIVFVTPLGGLSFILGWLVLMVTIPPSKKKYVENKDF